MLKKMMILVAATLFAGNAVAATTAAVDGLDIAGFKSSKNVSYAYGSAGDPADRYAIATKHTQGNNIYATYSGSASIYVSTDDDSAGTKLVAGKLPTLPGSATDEDVTGGAGSWTAM